MSGITHLLIIDPQNDFCDLPASYLPQNPLNTDQRLKPQLPVPGAHADMHRLAHFIRRGKDLVDRITITLDSHHHVGIERPALWRQSDGSPVAPFTQISSDDVRQGKYVLKNPDYTDRVLDYLDALESAGRYTHMVWPTHCEIGTWGHNIHADVLAACNVWEQRHARHTDKIIKGDNPYTEHYSALIAEVPDADDPATGLNRKLLDSMAAADTLLVAGEAGSHCVKATLEHYVQHVDPERVKRIVLLTDCMSPINGFEEPYQAFLEDMEKRGARLMTSAAWLKDNTSPS
ncbi:MAG TPA: cysteine hydrolase [Burkholderiaceae bacterium]|nr:cysteine hydrolase [Burkholderiaceae bacterium]